MTENEAKSNYSEVMPNQEEAEKKEEEEENRLSSLSPMQLFFHHCRSGKLDELKKVYNKSKDEIDINQKDTKDSREEGWYGGGNTPLHYACQYGHLEIVQFLFNLQVSVNEKNKLGNTPLLVSCSNGRTEVVRFLLSKSADETIKNKIGNTCLHVAVYAGHVEIVKQLLDIENDKKTALQQGNGCGMTPVKYCSHQNMTDYLRQFFPKKFKRDPLIKETRGSTSTQNGVEEINDDEMDVDEQEPIEMQEVTNKETNEE